jgi:hypothetical protein
MERAPRKGGAPADNAGGAPLDLWLEERTTNAVPQSPIDCSYCYYSESGSADCTCFPAAPEPSDG